MKFSLRALLVDIVALGLVVGLVCFLPPILIEGFQRSFGYHATIVPYHLSIHRTICYAIVLVSAIIALFSRRFAAPLFAYGLLLWSAIYLLIVALSSFSNSYWGESLDFFGALSLLSYYRSLPQYVSLPIWQIVPLVILALVCLALLGAISMHVFKRAAACLFSCVTYAHKSFGRVAEYGTLLMLLSLPVVPSSNVLSQFAKAREAVPEELTGEPLRYFFGLEDPTLHTVITDPVKLQSAFEDSELLNSFAKNPNKPQKNIILLFGDSLRPDNMGVYGYQRETTPFLSRLLAEGKLAKIEFAVSACADSYCGIANTLTGRSYREVSAKSVKLNQILDRVGYTNTWILAGDHFTGWKQLGIFYGTGPYTIFDRRNVPGFSPGDDRMVVQALERLPQWDGSPHFLYFFLMSAHVSGDKFPEFQKFTPASIGKALYKWNEKKPDVPASPEEIAERQAVINMYDNGMLQFDAYVEKIFSLLEAKGFLQNSIVFILGDHGDSLGEHEHFGHSRYLYQENIRIPILVFDPSGSNIKNTKFATHLDIAPTILQEIGLEIPSSWKGRPLQEVASPRRIFLQTNRSSDACRGVLQWTPSTIEKFQSCGVLTAAKNEFFDLVNDPREISPCNEPECVERSTFYLKLLEERRLATSLSEYLAFSDYPSEH
jgi:hypothetical protein